MNGTARTTLRRRPERGHYDRDTIHAILDGTFVCHIGFLHDGHPFVVPTIFGRQGDDIYVHGAAASRMQNVLAAGADICLTVTITDGIVLARSAFRSSMNYRSAVILGRAIQVTASDEKLRGLAIITNHVVPGRWEDVRPPTAQELSVTSVLRISIHEASAKIRDGGPIDDERDLAFRVWAGVVPLRTCIGEPEPDAKLADAISVPAYIEKLRQR
jgi:uncharacterized protein